MPDAQGEVTTLLNRAGAGDPIAGEQLMQQIAGELHRLAASYMRGERAGHLLQPTALVNELYMKLFLGGTALTVNNRSHFFAMAAMQMRRILVDHARNSLAGKRHGLKVEFDELFHGTGDKDRSMVALDDALNELETLHPDLSRLVELRFFGGYSHEETAEILCTNVAKVRRDWEFARSWLFDRTAR